MQTHFSLSQLADADTAMIDNILRNCVHCGICTATCPTYLLTGDECDSPRGRIYMMKSMYEQAQPAGVAVAHHIDRCLSCLSCMTTCPANVDYMHLVDHTRAHIEATGKRTLRDRTQRWLVANVISRPLWFRLALIGARMLRPLLQIIGPITSEQVRAVLTMAPDTLPRPSAITRPGIYSPVGPVRTRVVLHSGCAQQVLRPSIHEASIRLLNQLGCEVILPEKTACCGALSHHMGREKHALAQMRTNIDAIEQVWRHFGQVDAVISNASGCGVQFKDYGHCLRHDPEYSQSARKIATLSQDISEFIACLGAYKSTRKSARRIAYHAACALQHGQNIIDQPLALLREAGFNLLPVEEGHICCGSAGTYNLLQPSLATQLRDRKLAHIAQLQPDLIVTGNIGCLTQLESAASVPVVHIVELLDWASGGTVLAHMPVLSADTDRPLM